MLNGDHVWNMYVRKNGLRGHGEDGKQRPNYREVGVQGDGRSRPKGPNPMNGRK